MLIRPEESITLAIAGANVTLSAQQLTELWIAKIMRESPGPESFGLKRPALRAGEIYIAGITRADEPKIRHLVLLPGDNAATNQQEQMAWAESIGGQLPDRVESALLYAMFTGGHLKGEFHREGYWTREQHAAYPNYAWVQWFVDGHQYGNLKDNHFRARAVRSEPIE